MTQPLTLLAYERLFPGAQLASRLEDLGYRVKTVADPEQLVAIAEQEKPLMVIVDLGEKSDLYCTAVGELAGHPTTAHLPVIALTPAHNAAIQQAARASGASLVVHDNVILTHLAQFLQQALQLD